MPRPTVPDLAELLYDELAITQPADEQLGWPFLILLAGFAAAMGELPTIVRDTDDGPGWSAVLDVDRCPTWALPWLAQFVGVQLNPALPEDQQRALITSPPAFQRGTVAAIRAAAQALLTGGKRVELLERDSSPYHVTVITYQAETPATDWDLITNLVKTPSFEYGVGDWAISNSGSSSSLTGLTVDPLSGQSTVWSKVGSHSFRVKVTKDNTATSRSLRLLLAPPASILTKGIPVLPGEPFAAAAWIHVLDGWGTAGQQLIVRWYKPDGSASATATTTGASVLPAAATGDAMPTVLGTVPGDATLANLYLASDAGSITPLDTADLFLDAAAFYQRAALPDYGDGDQPGWAWNGTPGSSTSHRVLTTLVRAALLKQKPAGLILTHRVDPGWSIGEMEAAYSTIGALEGAFATVQTLESQLPD